MTEHVHKEKEVYITEKNKSERVAAAPLTTEASRLRTEGLTTT